MSGKQNQGRQYYLGIGAGLGIALGAGLGVALGNLALGIGIGLPIGAGLGVILGGKSTDKSQQSSETGGRDDA